MKRLWSLLLALLLIPCLAVAASAAETTGKCGENLTWVFDSSTGALTISGTGDMNNFFYEYEDYEDYWYEITTPWNRSKLKTVEILEGVTSVGDAAFYSAENLEEVILPSSIQSIGYKVFSYCKDLKITLPGNDQLQIDKKAFFQANIAAIEIPAGMTKLPVTAFGECTVLRYTVADDHPAFFQQDGILFSKDRTMLIDVPDQYPFQDKQYTIPDTVTAIDAYAFRRQPNLNSITLPESVNAIGLDAFDDCWYLDHVYISSLEKWLEITFASQYSNPLNSGGKLYLDGEIITDLVIPEGTTVIGDYAFCGMDHAGSITVPASVTSIGNSAFKLYNYTAGPVRISDLAAWSEIRFATQSSNPIFRAGTLFVNGEALTELVVPDGVTCIGDYVYNGCESLNSITLPNSVTTIGKKAFSECTGLLSVYLPDSVTTIGEGAFEVCYEMTDIRLPGKLTELSKGVFYACSAMTSITLPNTLTTIGANAFEQCSLLASINIPEGVTTIGNGAFYRCRKLESVTVPDSVTSIGGAAFAYCSGLREVNLGKGVQEMGGSVFAECKRVKKLSIPGAIGTVRNYFAKDCISLEELIIGEGITFIDYEAFAGCTKLKSVSFPSTLQQIRREAFKDCTALTDFHVPTIRTWTGLEFLYVNLAEEGPDVVEPYYSYKYLMDWNKDPKNLYVNGKKLTNLVVPEGTYLAEYIFATVSIESVTIPGSVIIISDDAFRNCASLESVLITNGIADINDAAFMDCTKLKTLTIPSSLDYVGDYAFDGCTNLSKVNYGGSKADREELTVESGNTELEEATWEYNCNLDLMPPTVSITGVASSGKPKVTWTAVEGAERYRVYRATSKSGSYTYLGYTTELSYTDKTAKAGTNYFYKVKSFDNDTQSASFHFSNIVNRCCDLKKPVVTLKVDTASGKPKVTFEKISGAEKYYIVRATSEKGTYTKLATTTSTSYIDKTAKAGKTYYYKVKALHAKDSADSAYSAVTSRVCDLKKPVVTIFLKDGDPRIKWDAITGAVKYQVYRATSRDGEYTLVKTTKTSTSYTDTNVKAGKTYYYKVMAIHENTAANSAYSAVKYIKAQ